MVKKSPLSIDKHIGARIRMRRLMLGLSQTELGNALGLSFQQVQKYEKGTNRVGGSRMQHMSIVLGVPVSWFYEGLPGQGTQALTIEDDFSTIFMADKQGIALARAFVDIQSSDIRTAIVAMAEAAAAKVAVAKPKAA